MSENNNELKKLTIFTLGNSAVGKSSFISKYVNNTFKDNYMFTIGIDFITKDYTLPNEKEIKLLFTISDYIFMTQLDKKNINQYHLI